MAGVNKSSEKYLAAHNRLPEELKPVFEQMVDEYAWETTKLYGRGYVAYEVLANLVLAGWRRSAESRLDE